MIDLQKQLEEAKTKRANAEQARIDAHNEAFAAAYIKAIETSGEEVSFVEANIPKVGKCLFKFAAKPDHAHFKREVNTREKPLELGTCVTYASKCAVFPTPLAFKELCDKYNVQGFEIAALKIHAEMSPKDDAEGKD